MRQARGLPVCTVGSCSVQGLRNLLSHVRPTPLPAAWVLLAQEETQVLTG